MHPKYRELQRTLARGLSEFADQVRNLPGAPAGDAREALAWQFVESRRKIDRTEAFQARDISPERAKPGSNLFDPEMAAVLSARNGAVENAFWLAFLSVHLGRHATDGWLLARQIYGGLGPEPYWTWDRISADPSAFRDWLNDTMRGRNIPLGRFGNHRKYETLNPASVSGTATVFASYVEWVRAHGSHAGLIQHALDSAGDNPLMAFARLYESMGVVKRFGRLGKFDFLTLIGKLGLASISPDSTYMSEATGPRRGASLLFRGHPLASANLRELETLVKQLESKLGVGMQAMEDALCNWQKSPLKFQAFRG